MLPTEFMASLRRGLTIVELLIVIAILSLVTAIMIPQMRNMSKEQGVREAARTVGAVFVEASNRARVEGFAGVAIVRNQNYVRSASSGGNPIYYTSNTLYQLKNKLPFVGNFNGELAEITSLTPVLSSLYPGKYEFNVEIPTAPYDNTVKIEKYCTIQLGNNPSRYFVVGIVDPIPPILPTPGSPMTVRCLAESFQVVPAFGSQLTFRVFRRPEIATGTRVDLPRGYYINLNYSGSPSVIRESPDVESTWTMLTEDIDPAANDEPIYILFNSTGGIDRIFSNSFEVAGATNYRGEIPITALNLCICPDDNGNSFDLSGSKLLPKSYYDKLAVAGGPDALNDPTLMWISINHQTGTVGIGENASTALIPNPTSDPGLPVGFAANQADRILQALGIAGKRKIATQ